MTFILERVHQSSAYIFLSFVYIIPNPPFVSVQGIPVFNANEILVPIRILILVSYEVKTIFVWIKNVIVLISRDLVLSTI